MENIVRPIDRDRAKLQEMRRSDPPMEAEKRKDGKLPKKNYEAPTSTATQTPSFHFIIFVPATPPPAGPPSTKMGDHDSYNFK